MVNTFYLIQKKTAPCWSWEHCDSHLRFLASNCWGNDCFEYIEIIWDQCQSKEKTIHVFCEYIHILLAIYLLLNSWFVCFCFSPTPATRHHVMTPPSWRVPGLPKQVSRQGKGSTGVQHGKTILIIYNYIYIYRVVSRTSHFSNNKLDEETNNLTNQYICTYIIYR